MTKLKELKAAADAAYDACNAACATYAIACKAARDAVRVADADYAAAYHAWIQAELNKTKEQTND